LYSLIFAWMGAPAGSDGQGSMILLLLPWILILMVIYFLMIRPQVKRQKQHKVMVETIKKGDKVIAGGGIVGNIAGFKEKENTVILKVDENVKLEVLRTSITSVLRKE